MGHINRYTQLEPTSGKKPKQLVVLIHGYGSNADDLISLAPELAAYLPDAHFVSPNAPFPLDRPSSFESRQWFSLIERTELSMLEGLRNATPILRHFIADRIKELGISSWQDVALLGFSQGAMLALHLSLRESTPVKGVLCYSGMLVAPQLIKTEIQSRPPCLLIHGEDDDIVPAISMAMTAKVLQDSEVPVTTMLRPGLMHGIDWDGVKMGGQFLQQIFQPHKQ